MQGAHDLAKYALFIHVFADHYAGGAGGGGHRYGCVYVMNSICNWDNGTIRAAAGW